MPMTLFRIRTLLMLPIAAAIFAVAALMLPSSAEAGGGGCHPGEPVTAARVTTVTMEKNCFGPTVALVAPGTEVTFQNVDPIPHTVTSAALSWGTDAMNFQGIQGGESVTQTFALAGVYPFSCILHPGMVGAVVVGDPFLPKDDVLASLNGGPDRSAAGRSDAASTSDDGVGGNTTAIVASASVAAAIVIIGVAVAVLYARTRQRESAGAAN